MHIKIKIVQKLDNKNHSGLVGTGDIMKTTSTVVIALAYIISWYIEMFNS